MANIIRRDPVTHSLFRKNMNDMFDNFFGTMPSLPEFANHGMMWLTSTVPMDVIDKGTAYLVKANLPGVERKDIDIQINENVLTLSGSFTKASEEKTERYLVQERRSGNFSRSVVFGEEVIAEKASAQFKDGLLELIVPKAEAASPKKVRIDISD